jgi:hypothetical protein
MKTLRDVLQYVDATAFALLAIVTYRQWLRRGDEGAKWAFATFGSLGFIAVLGLFLPEESTWGPYQWFLKVLIIVIVFFPYFLFRISSSFRPGKSRLGPVALVATVAVAIWTFFLPEFPGPDDPQPDALRIWVYALVGVWVALSAVVAVRFWRAGTGQPAVARKRMRFLSIASVILSIGIVISTSAGGGGSGEDYGREAFTQSLTLASVLAFFLAFAPPRWLRQTWRRPVEESLRRGTLQLMASDTTAEVMGVLLPHAIGIVGGEGIAVLDTNGKVIGSQGMDPAAIARAGNLPHRDDPTEADAATGLVHLEFEFGALVVQTGPYTPFFGQDEIDLLGALGALANLAMERVEAGDLRVQLERANIRRSQALEINDNIVQGLAVAKYSFDLGQEDKAREAIEGTLVAARAIISELLDDIGGEVDFGPGALTRGHAATGFMDPEITKERTEDERGR